MDLAGLSGLSRSSRGRLESIAFRSYFPQAFFAKPRLKLHFHSLRGLKFIWEMADEYGSSQETLPWEPSEAGGATFQQSHGGKAEGGLFLGTVSGGNLGTVSKAKTAADLAKVEPAGFGPSGSAVAKPAGSGPPAKAKPAGFGPSGSAGPPGSVTAKPAAAGPPGPAPKAPKPAGVVQKGKGKGKGMDPDIPPPMLRHGELDPHALRQESLEDVMFRSVMNEMDQERFDVDMWYHARGRKIFERTDRERAEQKKAAVERVAKMIKTTSSSSTSPPEVD